MSLITKSLSVSALALTMATVGASAATIDFTAAGLSSTGTTAGVDWALSSSGGNLNFSTPADHGIAAGTDGLAFATDGIGIRDDEVTFPQTLTLTFTSGPVTITGLSYLDLFGGEVAVSDIGVNVGDDGTGSAGGYYFVDDLEITGVTSITFSAAGQLDDDTLDFALAAVDFAPIPLPAGGLLLVAALGGLAASRRRKA